jgi:hypothetical protein
MIVIGEVPHLLSKVAELLLKFVVWTVKNLTSALDCATKSMAMVSFALTFYPGGR